MIVGQRNPREECPAFLAFVRRKPCCACHAPAPSQAAHIRMASRAAGKRSTGMGEKPSDRWAVPLCSDCHLDSPEAQHKVGEQVFWYRVGVDPCSLAATLWAQFERRQARSPEQREKVIKRATSVKRAKVRREKRKGGAAPKVSRRFVIKTKVSRSRPIQNGNQWPPRGSRKLRSRG